MTVRVAAAVLITLALPAAAQAATVSVHVPPCAPEQSKYGACYPDEARFAAVPGERNQVTVTRLPAEPPSYAPRITIADAGAPLTAGAGCAQVDEHSASCTGYNLIAIVDTGDGDDVVSGPAARVASGDGNDTVSGAQIQDGSAGDDSLRASDTGSQLTGGPGRDTLVGGPAPDTFVDGGPIAEEDVVDGAGGLDTLAYDGRKAGITVSLADLAVNEDRLTAIEAIRGGDGNDTLTGDAAANGLDGGAGADVLSGGSGDDVIGGDSGADRIDGGSGDDTLHPGEDKARNTIACGPGFEYVDPEPNTLIGSDCERIGIDSIDVGGIVQLHLPVRSARTRLLTMRPDGCSESPCRIRLTLTGTRGTARGVLLGSLDRVQPQTGSGFAPWIGLRLNPRGLRLLRRGDPLRARIRIAIREDGELTASSFLADVARR